MNVPIRISVNDQGAAEKIKLRMQKANPHLVASRVAGKLMNYWKQHLAKLPTNKNGYPTTGFWERAAHRVIGIAQGSNVLLQSDSIGLRKRYYGGTTKAIKGKYVTIPICREAYGTTTDDWGRENLVLVILADGRRFLALWLGNQASERSFNRSFKAKYKLAEGTTRRANKLREKLANRKKAPTKPNVIIFRGSGASGTSHAERHMNIKFLFRLMTETGAAEAMTGIIPDDITAVAREEARKVLKY